MSFEFEAGFFADLLNEHRSPPRKVIVIGCGDGREVETIATRTRASVIGVDLDIDPAWRGKGIDLVRADARQLPFRSATFDAVYCYHVLEHVPGPERAVGEARRVMTKPGLAFFGTPNRSRLAGYAGGRATLWEKIRWNAVDYWKRVTGRWSNELGAHAGFTDRELSGLLGSSFERVESVSLPYYVRKHPRLEGLWRTSFRLGLDRFLAPSVYFRATAPKNGRPGHD